MGFYSKVHTLSSSAKILKIGCDLTNFRESLKVGTLFLRHNVEQRSIYQTVQFFYPELRLVYCISLYLNILCAILV